MSYFFIALPKLWLKFTITVKFSYLATQSCLFKRLSEDFMQNVLWLWVNLALRGSKRVKFIILCFLFIKYDLVNCLFIYTQYLRRLSWMNIFKNMFSVLISKSVLTSFLFVWRFLKIVSTLLYSAPSAIIPLSTKPRCPPLLLSRFHPVKCRNYVNP